MLREGDTGMGYCTKSAQRRKEGWTASTKIVRLTVHGTFVQTGQINSDTVHRTSWWKWQGGVRGSIGHRHVYPQWRPSNDQWRPPDSHEGLYENRWNEIAHRDGKWPSDYLFFGHSQKASLRWSTQKIKKNQIKSEKNQKKINILMTYSSLRVEKENMDAFHFFFCTLKVATKDTMKVAKNAPWSKPKKIK